MGSMESEGGRVPQGEELIPSAHYGLPAMDRPSSELSQTSGLPRPQSSTLDTKPTFAHPTIPKQSIGDLMRAQSQQNVEDAEDGDEGDDDDDDDEKDDDDADDSEDEDEDSEEEEEDEDDTINMSSSMLGGESEVSAMSEDISLPSLSITPSKKATTQSKQDLTPSESRSVSGSSTPKTLAPVKTPGTGKKRGRPSKAVMREREEAKRARGELPEEKPKIDWASMSEEQKEILKREKREELREKRAQKMRELRQQKKDNRAAAKAAILKEKAEKKAARKAAAEAKRLKKKEHKKKGPAKKILTEAEREAREALRKA